MGSSSKSLTKLLATVLVIAALAYIAGFGATMFGMKIPSVLDEDGIRQGLDLKGGSVITFEAKPEEGQAAPTEEDMTTVRSMLRQRLDSLGYTEATVSAQGATRVRVEMPDISNPQEAVEKLGATAKLTFVDSAGAVILDGVDVKDARKEYGPTNEKGTNENYVTLEFTPEGQKKFAEGTARAAAMGEGKNFIAIMLDDNAVSQPRVQEAINSDSAIISGSFDSDSAKYLADVIKAGKLPYALDTVELRTVGPTLGDKALSTSLFAGALGVLIIMLFMLLIYRLPGFISCISLTAYIAIVCLVLAISKTNLSLPGIAGIILGIGMAVDANIIIFERMKEDLRAGKTVGAAVDSGFHRAFTAILDANVTTFIAAAVLWYFGTGPIQGFAITLGIGIIVSMFTAIVITKFMLKQMVGLNIRNKKLYL